MLSRLAEIDRNFDRLLARKVARSMGNGRSQQQRGSSSAAN
jgi:hypothetical protein